MKPQYRYILESTVTKEQLHFYNLISAIDRLLLGWRKKDPLQKFVLHRQHLKTGKIEFNIFNPYEETK